MKKTISPLVAVLMVSLSLVSCGSKENKSEETTGVVDSVKTEAVAQAPEAPAVKDFNYYSEVAKAITIDGVTLTSYNAYVDSSTKSFSYSYNANPESGVDFVIINAGKTSMVVNADFKASQESLDGYKTYVTNLFKSEKGVKIGEFKEYKKNDGTFYYFTYIQPIGKSQFDNKYFHNVKSQFVNGDVYLEVMVSVKDKSGDPARAEAVLQKVADHMGK
ncbi:MAG: hypothetical protein V4677_13165 [Bacteroidota bacterium]